MNVDGVAVALDDGGLVVVAGDGDLEAGFEGFAELGEDGVAVVGFGRVVGGVGEGGLGGGAFGEPFVFEDGDEGFARFGEGGIRDFAADVVEVGEEEVVGSEGEGGDLVGGNHEGSSSGCWVSAFNFSKTGRIS